MTLLQEISKNSREYRGTSRAERIRGNEASEGYAFVGLSAVEDWTCNTRVMRLPTITRAVGSSVFVTRYEVKSNFEQELTAILEELKALENDWDGDDALAPIIGNLQHAEQFLLKVYNEVTKMGLKLPIPELNPCNDGSLDVVWRQPENFLLLNFREPEEGLVQYYFDRYDTKLARQGALLLSDPTPTDFKLYLQAVAK